MPKFSNVHAITDNKIQILSYNSTCIALKALIIKANCHDLQITTCIFILRGFRILHLFTHKM